MDTITHGILGALIGKSFFAEDVLNSSLAQVQSWRDPPPTTSRVAIVSLTLGAIFPDVDVFAGPLAHNRLAFMTWHRGITHSIVLLPVWSVLLALITYWVAPRLRWPAPRLANLVTIYAVGLVSHIFLDVITSFGTMALSPISYERFSLDWVFIVDLIMTSLVLLPQLAAWAFHRPEHAVQRAVSFWALCSAAAFVVAALVRPLDIPFPNSAALGASVFFAGFFLLPLRRGIGVRTGRAKWCRIGVVLAAAYLMFAATMHNSAVQHVRQFAADARLNVQNLGAMPLPPSPARWAGLIATRDGVYRLQFNEIANEPLKIQFFANAAPNQYINAARELRDVQTFLWFARFPVFQFLERQGQPVVQITDMRFYGTRRPGARSSENPAANFTFEVVFSPDGRSLSHGLLEPD
jgi:membrane-bound metal-dependent hydrolase YbcI (DUF457 family)